MADQKVLVDKQLVNTIQMNAIDPERLRAFAASPVGTPDIVLGTVIGKIDGFSYRANPQNPAVPSIALTGYFEAVPDNVDAPILIGASVYLPPALQSAILSSIMGDAPRPDKPIERGKKIDISLGGGAKLPIACEIGVKRSKVEGQGAGYEFTNRLKMDAMATEDILGDLREHVGNRGAITGPGADVKQLAAPAAKSGKGAKGKRGGK